MRVLSIALSGTICALILLPPWLALARVNQVTGKVLPVQAATTCPWDLDHCLQTGLNYGEGINPPNASTGAINAVLDANTGPETFTVPKDAAGKYGAVTFRLLQEGTPNENIFGWYNVGSPSKRYPLVLSCAASKKSTYEPAAYSTGTPQKLAGEYTVVVDFQKESAAGNYAGSKIGFYLISPEGSKNDKGAASTVEYCATDPSDLGTLANSNAPIDDDAYNENDGHDDDNGFGRIYYTESKLNNDGDHVHFLIYPGKKSSTHFYLAFEDLFRTGDDDFDDTLIKAEGLLPACQAAQEVCNGKDDNCNGKADENVFRACTTVCGQGLETCKFTDDSNPANDWINCSSAPVKESCDGKDNDCNGVVDDNVSGEGLPCNHPSGKTCTQGKTKCVLGKITCVGATTGSGSPEVCDCLDNDCNGLKDDGTNLCSTIECPTCSCQQCGCRVPCSKKDGCPKGYACSGGYCLPNKCANVTCTGFEKCVDGKCVDLCTGKTCPSGQVCKGGDCVEDNCYGKGCPAGQICYQSQCIPDPCVGIIDTCKAGEFCENGVCKPSCAAALCGAKGKCQYGKCVENLCAKVNCISGAPCYDGVCHSSCEGVACDKETADPDLRRICKDAKCVDNPCALVTCKNPAIERCERGQCVSANTYAGERIHILPSGGGFDCNIPSGGGGPAAPPSWPTLLLMAGLLLAARRVR